MVVELDHGRASELGSAEALQLGGDGDGRNTPACARLVKTRTLKSALSPVAMLGPAIECSSDVGNF
jgi:hypothetical protein